MIWALVAAIVAADLVLRLVFRRSFAGGAHPSSGWRWVRVAVNLGGLATLALVAYTALFHDGPVLTGSQLISHVTYAPAFAVAAVAVAICWADRSRFAAQDWHRGWALPLRKLFFWIAIALAIPTFVSILAAMFPIADTEGQQTLLRVHRTCGPIFAAMALLFAYFALMAWREGSKD
ncbi:MAG TPA: hypothetical protein VHW09_23845 [Bryobacteraceae bacterium]|nr:hypothetical protein [Bryobacteraceae bacterium]